MEPTTPIPGNNSAEAPPPRAPVSETSPDLNADKKPAPTEKMGEVAASPGPAATSQPPTTQQPPPAQVQPQATQTAATDQSLASLPAEDVDLIEKQWVEKVDETIAKTKDDPHSEEEAQQNLSKTYLKKRFNIDVDL